MTDGFEHWREALAEKRGVETEKGSIRLGYYRRRNEAVAYWKDDDGYLLCWRSDNSKRTPTKPDEMEDLFSFCAPTPVSYDDFKFFQANGRWPEQIEQPAKPDPNLPPEQAIDAEITALHSQAGAWIADVGTIKSQAEADKAANYSEAFAALEKRAEDIRVTEKAPFLEGGRFVDAKWKPLIERAAVFKAWAKKATEPFLIAEKARLAEEERKRVEEAARIEREAMAARVHAARTGLPPPPEPEKPLPPQPQRAGAGTAGRKVALRTRTVVSVTDRKAFMLWLSERNDLDADFVGFLGTMANRMVSRGQSPKGVEVKQEESAA